MGWICVSALGLLQCGAWQVHLLVCEDALHLRDEAQLSHCWALLFIGLHISLSCCVHLAEETLHQGVQVCWSTSPVDSTQTVVSAALLGQSSSVLQKVVHHAACSIDCVAGCADALWEFCVLAEPATRELV